MIKHVFFMSCVDIPQVDSDRLDNLHTFKQKIIVLKREQYNVILVLLDLSLEVKLRPIPLKGQSVMCLGHTSRCEVLQFL